MENRILCGFVISVSIEKNNYILFTAIGVVSTVVLYLVMPLCRYIYVCSYSINYSL